MPDFGFVGASYTTRSIYQDDQECINFYPEIDPTKQPGERGIVALYPTPGLVTEITLPAASEVRGMRALSGLQYAIAVSGDKVYLIQTDLTYTEVGTLSSNVGPVSISDNQMTTGGLTAYIVDGLNRYYYVVSTNTFVTLPSTDGPWQGATVTDVVDGYILYNQPDTQNWSSTDLDSPLSTQAWFGTKNGSPDNLVSLIVDHRQVYLLGEVTTEVWVDVGSQITGLLTFPFQRVSGTASQNGCGAAFSVARFAETFMFLARDTLGTATIGIMQGYEYKRLSTHAVENSLVGVDVTDARAWTYQVEGHEFYVITFPNADITWVYDLATQQWHKWLYWDTPTATYHRHRANCGIAFANKNLVGDWENGKIYSLNFDQYTDAGSPIRRLRRAPHITTDLQRQYFEEFQIQFQPGVGLTTGQGDNPQAMLRWSNDGGSTWSNEHWTSIGRQGAYQNRAIWRRLGWSRDRIFEVAVTDPVKAVVVSANLKASAGDN
jgi:hypothetical protein